MIAEKRLNKFDWFQLLGLLVLLSALMCCSVRADSSASDRIELKFELPQVQGNPFDFTVNDVRVTFSTPGQEAQTLPAFFDGGTIWRVRHTPTTSGHYSVRAISLNGKDANAQAISKREFDFVASPDNGFVRIDPKDKMRFAFDDGSPFYPVGYNLAWKSHGPVEMPPLVDSLGRMGKAGVNWSRIWMNYWDGKNLDWPLADQEPVKPGTLLLPVANAWDAIVQTAQKNHIHFQMVLQHHGQYSTGADANWQLNPWNKANGGWLESPEQFFTDPRAIQLTKNKFRYIVARWGYSPSIMAFELFNEVESTNGFKKDLPSVAGWHKTMADFLREQDHYHHLITTSSDTTRQSLWPAMDYYQAHAYPSDLISAIAGLEDQKLGKPYFYGEMGESSGTSTSPARTLHQILWSSLMSGSAGTGQYWDWFDVEPLNLLGQFTSVQKFITGSGMLLDRQLKPAAMETQTPERGLLEFGPGRDWAPSTSKNFVINQNGTVENLGGMSAFLQGNGANHAMFPFANFEVNYPAPGTFAVEVDQITAAGAQLQASVDGQLAATLLLGSKGNTRLNATLQIPVGAGPHSIRLENTGKDWVHIHQFSLTPYACELAVLGKISDRTAVLWVYRRSVDEKRQPIKGTIKIPGLTSGSYRVVWWDTDAGKILSEATSSVTDNQPLSLSTPAIDVDAGCWILLSH